MSGVDFRTLPPRELALAFIRWARHNRFESDTNEIVKELRRGSPGASGPGYTVDVRGLRCTVYRARGHDLQNPYIWTLHELVSELKAERQAESRRARIGAEQPSLWEEVAV